MGLAHNTPGLRIAPPLLTSPHLQTCTTCDMAVDDARQLQPEVDQAMLLDAPSIAHNMAHRRRYNADSMVDHQYGSRIHRVLASRAFKLPTVR